MRYTPPAKKRLVTFKKRARAKPEQTRQFTDAEVRPSSGREPPAGRFIVTDTMLARARGRRRGSLDLARRIFAAAVPMPGVVPAGKATLAMDEQIETAIGWAANSIYQGAFQQGVMFMGYPYLAELAQRAEYRRISEVIATEMTRKWIEIKVHNDDDEDEAKDGDEDSPDDLNDDDDEDGGAKPPELGADGPLPPALASKSPAGGAKTPPPIAGEAAVATPGDEPDEEDDAQAEAEQEKQKLKDQRVKQLEEEFKRLNVQACFKELAEQDGFFGRSHLYVATKAAEENKAEMVMPIGDGNDPVTQAKIAVGDIVRLKTVEAIWCYPANYNSANPLAINWYKPSMWFVQGMEVHASRLLSFVGREVPDMLKPAYSFGGLALSQMAQPTVQNWLRTRQSVSDIIHSFTVFVLKTNLSTTLQEDGDQLFKRADFFNEVRDNRGLMMISKDDEDFVNVSASLASLDKLQAQSQEHICAITGIPLVKYTGISPSGLNASSEGEIRVFYDWIAAYQEAFFKPNLTRIFHLAQMNLWGQVDPDLYFEFVPLWELTEKEEAEVRKVEAETDAALINAQVLQPEESRKRLSQDMTGPYAGIDVNDVPEPDPMMGDPMGQRAGFNQQVAGPGGGKPPPIGADPLAKADKATDEPEA